MRMRSMVPLIAACVSVWPGARLARAGPVSAVVVQSGAAFSGDEQPLGGTSIERATAEGAVRGYWHKGTWHFRGIPYARPPVGEQRWRAPVPPARRAGVVLDAAAWGPVCPQAGAGSPFPTLRQDEDCLNLNVWTRTVAGAKPVMVWIHGGGFVLGSPVLTATMGDLLAREHEVVVVTINYRLGALGFLAHRDLVGDDPARPQAAGNYGILDQIRALEWVHDNIASFGGDPRNVTIFGESAGGISVLGLLASPLGERLFHKAIVQSGPAWGDFEMDELHGAAVVSDGFAERLGCVDLACMRAAPSAAVVAAHGVGPFGFLEAPERALLPVRDGHVFPQSILARFRAGRPRPAVPLLLGSNSLEGALPQVSLSLAGVSDWAGWARALFGAPAGDALEDQYLGGQYAFASQAAGEMLADILFNCPTRRIAGLAGAARARVWVYWFDYPTSLLPGALHGSEIPFVFGNVDGLASSREWRASRSLAAYWTRFARNGDPNGGSDARWDPWPASYLEVKKRAVPAQARPGAEYMSWSDAGNWRDDSPAPLQAKAALCDRWEWDIEPRYEGGVGRR